MHMFSSLVQVVPMSLFACLGQDAVPIRDAYVRRLSSSVEVMEVWCGGVVCEGNGMLYVEMCVEVWCVKMEMYCVEVLVGVLCEDGDVLCGGNGV